MPNICYSNVRIYSQRCDLRKALKPVLDKEGVLHSNLLIKDEHDDSTHWYEFNSKNLGTKWHFKSDDSIELEKHYAQAHLETAWSCPESYLHNLLYFLVKTTGDESVCIETGFADEHLGQWFGESRFHVEKEYETWSCVIDGHFADIVEYEGNGLDEDREYELLTELTYASTSEFHDLIDQPDYQNFKVTWELTETKIPLDADLNIFTNDINNLMQ